MYGDRSNPRASAWPRDAHLVGDPDPVVPPAPPGNPPAPAPPAPGTPPAPAEPFATFPDSESFQKRVDRETKKRMREAFGTDDEAAIKARLEAESKLAKEAEAAKLAQMSEIERAKAEKATAEAAAAAAMSRAEEAEMRSHLYGVFAKKGIRNHEYGFFAVTNALANLGAGETLDENEFLDKLIADPAQKLALGFDSPPTQPKPVGANTTPAGTPPTPPGSSNAPETPKSDMALSADEWAKKKRALGIQ